MYYDNNKRIYRDKQDIERRCKLDSRMVDRKIKDGEFTYFERRMLTELIVKGIVDMPAIEYATINGPIK